MRVKTTLKVGKAGAAACILAACWAIGCGQPQLRISGGGTRLEADDGSAGYLDRISSLETISQNDAFRGILMLLEIDDADDTFGQRAERLADRRIISRRWRLEPDRPVTRGQVAYMIYQAADVRGGLILTLTGPSQRYCLRELQYRGIMAKGSMFAEVGGGEFVAVLSRADSYRRTGEVPRIKDTSGG